MHELDQSIRVEGISLVALAASRGLMSNIFSYFLRNITLEHMIG